MAENIPNICARLVLLDKPIGLKNCLSALILIFSMVLMIKVCTTGMATAQKAQNNRRVSPDDVLSSFLSIKIRKAKGRAVIQRRNFFDR